MDHVLYTFCADNVLRIWATTDHHGLQIMQLWAQIDLLESIQVRSSSSLVRFAFIIDGRDFVASTEAAVQKQDDKQDDHALDHLIEIANRNPEICVVLDNRGHLSAWGMENVGCKKRQATKIFNITHLDGLNLGLPGDATDPSKHVQIHNFANRSDGGLHVLIHHFDGRIEYFDTNVANLFDPSPRPDRLISRGIWTGHSEPLKKIIRNASGEAVITRTESNESIVWIHPRQTAEPSIVRQSCLDQSMHIHRLCVMRKGAFAFILHHNLVTLWDTRSTQAIKLAELDYSISGKPLCILILPEDVKAGPIAHLATITSKYRGLVWEVLLPLDGDSKGGSTASIKEFCRFELGESEDLAYVLPVDPAGSAPVVPGFLDTFARDIALSYTHAGHVRSWTAQLDTSSKTVQWLETCSVLTGIRNPALASGSSIRKAALVNEKRSELTIWDIRGARLEYSVDYESRDFIQDLDWTSTPDDQSILAVGFNHRVLLLAQLRYDYLDKGPAWATIREIDIRDMTAHPIGDSAWLSDGNLIVGAGNQLFVYDKQVDLSAPASTELGLAPRKQAWNLFDVVSKLNGPLPVYHPQFLIQCMLAGKNFLVQTILLAFYKTLKYYVEEDVLDPYLGLDMAQFYTASGNQDITNRETGITFDALTDEETVDTVTESVAAAINEKLSILAIPGLSRQEQIHFADLVECVANVEMHRRSLDDNATRFMLMFRQHVLRRGRGKDANLSWREINFAYYSGSQDMLLDMIARQHQGRILWKHARESGIFMWLTDINAIVRMLSEFLASMLY